MRSMTKYLTVIVMACAMTAILSTITASAESDDIFSLKNLVTSFEDSLINSSDLAFFLAPCHIPICEIGINNCGYSRYDNQSDDEGYAHGKQEAEDRQYSDRLE